MCYSKHELMYDVSVKLLFAKRRLGMLWLMVPSSLTVRVHVKREGNPVRISVGVHNFDSEKLSELTIHSIEAD